MKMDQDVNMEERKTLVYIIRMSPVEVPVVSEVTSKL